LSQSINWSENRRAGHLGTLGGTKSWAYGINDSGQVVGYSFTPNPYVFGDYVIHAYLTGANGVGMTDLGTLGGTNSFAYGINASGQVVGSSNMTHDLNIHAFLYDGGAMMDLNYLLTAGLDGDAFLYSATAINDSGQIVAHSSDARSYLLTPIAASVPEPATAWLMVSALVGLGAARRRRV